MKYARTATALSAAALLVAACADTDDLAPGSDPDPAEQAEDDEAVDEDDDAPDEETDEEEAPDDLEPDEDEQAEGQFLHEFDDPIVYEDAGIRLAITGVGFTSMDSEVIDSEVEEFVEDDTRTLLGLEITVSNDSGEEVTVYANQGEVQIGREQVEADMWFSDSFAGEMRDGVDDDGLVLWQLTGEFDDVVGEEALDYVASAPTDVETWDQVGEQIELEVEWDS